MPVGLVITAALVIVGLVRLEAVVDGIAAFVGAAAVPDPTNARVDPAEVA